MSRGRGKGHGLLMGLAISTVLAMSPANAAEGDVFKAGMAAYEMRSFPEAETRFRAAIAEGRETAAARLMLGRTLVYLDRLDEARSEIRAARDLGLSPEQQVEADFALQYIAEAMAEVAEVPRKPLYEASAYYRREFVKGLARDASLDPSLTPRRKSDGRHRLGGGLGVEAPIGESGTAASIGLAVDQLLYDRFSDFDETNIRASGRLRQRLTDTWAVAAEYDAVVTLLEGQSYSLANRVGLGSDFRQYRHADTGLSLFGRVSVDWVNTSYETATVLNSNSLALSLTEQIRFRDPDTWLAASFTSGYSQAEESRYSYRLLRWMLHGQLGLSQFNPTEFLGDITLRMAVSHTQLDFSGLDSVQTDRARLDTINMVALGLTKPLTKSLSAVLDASYGHTNSNLTRNDYHSTLVSGGLRLNF